MKLRVAISLLLLVFATGMNASAIACDTNCAAAASHHAPAMTMPPGHTAHAMCHEGNNSCSVSNLRCALPHMPVDQPNLPLSNTPLSAERHTAAVLVPAKPLTIPAPPLHRIAAILRI